MNSIIRYVFAREIYNKYSENRGEIAHLLSLENIWSFLISIIAIIIAMSFSYSFSKKNDLKLSQLKLNDSLYVNNWNSHAFDEIPIYQMALEKNEYSNDTLKRDTIISYNLTQKVDSNFKFKKAIGIFNGKYIVKSNEEDLTDHKKLVGFINNSNLTLKYSFCYKNIYNQI